MSNHLLELEISLFKDGAFDDWELFPEQRTAMQMLVDKTIERLAYGGGANGGKSFLGCTWLLFMCLAFPGTRYFIGRKRLTDMEQSTLVTWGKVLKKHGVDAGVCHYNGQKHIIQFANGSTIELLVLARQPGDKLYERFGSKEYTAGWIEEGGEVDAGAADVLKSRVGRHLNDRYGIKAKILVTCNPKKNWLYHEFYKPWTKNALPSFLAFIQSLVHSNIYRERDSIRQLESLTNETMKARLLRGEWDYDDDPSRLFDNVALGDLFNNQHVPAGESFITADVARFGKDTTRIVLWKGWRAEQFVKLEKARTTEVAAAIRALMNTHAVPASRVCIDEDGVGGGVVDLIGGSVGFHAGATPVKIEGVKENYGNLKDQCSFRFAERVAASNVFVNCADPELRTTITEELEQVKQANPDGDGKLRVVGKDEMKRNLRRSPDVWDALMMREYLAIKKVEPVRFNFG